MAGASQSDDSSDIFWPGYVDAVTNVAIMLLFVVAISSIVVLGSSIEIARQKLRSGVSDLTYSDPGKTEVGTDGQVDGVMVARGLLEKLLKSKGDGTEDRAAMLENAKAGLDAAVQAQSKQAVDKKQQEEKLKELEEKLKQLQAQLDKARVAAAKLAAENPNEFKVASGAKAPPKEGAQEIEALDEGTVIVVFAPDAIELADAEQTELLKKLGGPSAVQSAKWQLQVRSAKGFSESSRVAFYRVNTLRNLLIKNGVPPANIAMQVREVDSGGNNARVSMKRVP